MMQSTLSASRQEHRAEFVQVKCAYYIIKPHLFCNPHNNSHRQKNLKSVHWWVYSLIMSVLLRVMNQDESSGDSLLTATGHFAWVENTLSVKSLKLRCYLLLQHPMVYPDWYNAILNLFFLLKLLTLPLYLLSSEEELLLFHQENSSSLSFQQFYKSTFRRTHIFHIIFC